jgi:RNA polymerase sigma factor (sigma-70 family)
LVGSTARESLAMTEKADDWNCLIEGLRRGDEQVARQFWQEYGPLLHRVADRHLPAVLRRRVEAEDVVQSALRTFLRRVQDGQFQMEDQDGLWRLLSAITLNKLRWQTRFHFRRKRGLNREQAVEPPSGEEGEAFQPAAPGPTPAEAAEFADQFQQLLASLDEEDCTNDEVAQRLGCSERTVRRILNRVKNHLDRALAVP